MKKYTVLSLLATGIFIAFFLIFNINDAAGSGKPVAANPAGSMPDSVFNFVKKTCMDCHADGGNAMAKGHVNFSKWDTYSAEKQMAKAQDICKVLTKGVMPKKGWLKENPDLAPKPADVEMVCKWAESLKK
ncbi:MAG: heme-binding domain-containing protein [Bacteroidales bacterium]|jgi:hypothetical protein|nr:heme-binding domain-containing protein [Bacteroidales bacterium]